MKHAEPRADSAATSAPEQRLSVSTAEQDTSGRAPTHAHCARRKREKLPIPLTETVTLQIPWQLPAPQDVARLQVVRRVEAMVAPVLIAEPATGGSG